MTTGASVGTSGGRYLGLAWLVVLGLLALVSFVDVTTALDDARRRGVQLQLWLPLTLELTSAAATTVAVFVALAGVRLAPPGRGPLWRTIMVHLVGTVIYSGVHVGLMTLLRFGAFAALGHRYAWSPQELPYEYRKDLLAYVVMGGIFWVFARRGPALAPSELDTAEPDPAAPATFDIRDGATLLRAPVAEIVAVKAAGNYVEFALQDGRRPLMRVSMARVEAALAPHGFVRTHRSWLVNPGRVRELSATGSGDFRIDLGDALTAPASRRYPQALARLRGER